MKLINGFLKGRNQFVLFFIFLCVINHAHAVRQIAVDVFSDASVDLISITSADQLQVQTGDGSGNFTVPAMVSLDFNPVDIAIGDFDLDGYNDLLALDSNGVLSVSLNDQMGGFLDETTLNAGLVNLESITKLHLADTNLDGYLDVVVCVDGLLNARAVILPGNGMGGFGGAVDIEFTGVVVATADFQASDINGDGFPDMLVKDILGILSVVLSDGLGGFDIPVVVPGVLPTGNIYFADFNNDQLPDMVVLNDALGLTTLQINNGDGTFTSGTSVTVGLLPADMVAVDINYDGHQDMVVVNIGDNTVNVILGDGLGGLTDAVGQVLTDIIGTLPPLNVPAAVVTSDVNGDCRRDLAIWNNTTEAYVIIINQTGPDPADLIYCSAFEQ
jgi:hypothetical protein